tara:strand:+ start:167 stop:556 length:390 start_codon:yes stop_codon:yes gene_type:complete
LSKQTNKKERKIITNPIMFKSQRDFLEIARLNNALLVACLRFIDAITSQAVEDSKFWVEIVANLSEAEGMYSEEGIRKHVTLIRNKIGKRYDEGILNKQTLENIEEVIARTKKAAQSLQPHLLAKKERN